MKPEPTVKKKKKKADLLRNLLGAEKHRHQVATITEEGEWNQHEPNGGMARVFVVMLLLHVFLIGGIILYDFIGTDEGASQTTHSVISTSSSAASSVAPIASSVNVTAPPVGEWDTYEVKSGDSLPNIAAKLGVDEAELIRLNELDGSVSLQPHSWLRVPHKKIAEPAKMATIAAMPALNPPATAATPAIEDSAPKAQPFTPMDTTLPDVTALTTTNETADNTPVVTPLAVDTPPAAPPAPKTVVAETPVPKAAPIAPRPSPVPPPSIAARKVEPTPAPPPVKKPAPASAPAKARSHTVAKGDTLYSMARTYGVSVSAIQKANGIKDPTTVRTGAKLVIPAP